MDPKLNTAGSEKTRNIQPKDGGVSYYARMASGAQFNEKAEAAVGELLEANKEVIQAVIMKTDLEKYRHRFIDFKAVIQAGRNALKSRNALKKR